MALTTYIPFPSVTAEPVLNIPLTNVNIALPKVATLNARPLSPLKPPSINLSANQLPTSLISSRIAHLGHGVTIPTVPISQTTALSEVSKSLKSEHPSKNSSKQILIAPKPSKTIASPVVNSSQGLTNLKNIAPKLPVVSGTPVTVSHLHSSTSILPASQMGHVIQAVQPLPVQALPQGVQPLQAITQNFPTIAGMTAAVQAVITQTMAINHNQLVTPSSPAKIITHPVFVTSSMPSMVGAPFDITMQNHLHGNVGTVARVVTQNVNVVGKVATKPQSPLVTLAPGNIESNVIPSIVPFHQTLQPGQPTQFVAVNMMPVAPSQISLQGPRHIAPNQMAPILCPQTMACIASSAGVPSASTPLNLIPHGSIVTCPIPDVNTGMCNSSLLQPLQCMPIYTQATQQLGGVPSASLENQPPVTIHASMTEFSSSETDKNSNIQCQESYDTEVPQEVDTIEDDLNSNCDNTELSVSISMETSISEEKVEYSSADAVLTNIATTPFDLIVNADTNVRQDNLKSENISEIKSSSLPKYTPIGTSPVVSHALSKLFPVSEPLVSVPTLVDGININTSQGTIDTPLQPSDASVKPPALHMILSNFVYTTTSVVIPKMSDQSMTSPKAVTKVSQSSPPYVLSTSTSNDIPIKSSNIVSKSSELNNLIEYPLPTSPSVDQVPLSKIENQDIITTAISVLKQCDTLSVSSTAAKLLGTIPSSSVSISISQKVNLPSENTEKPSAGKLDPKMFYSSSYQSKLIKEKKEVPRTSQSFVHSKTGHALNTQAFSKNALENKVRRNLNSTSSVLGSNLCDTGKINPNDKLQNTTDKSIKKQIILNNSKVTSKYKDLENKIQKKREPLFKKSLFKTKNSVESKPSEAFSPLNESSVYAFEPDTEPPLEMTSPFGQRIKNIQPYPSLSSGGKNASLKLSRIARNSQSLKEKKSFGKAKKAVVAPCQTENSKNVTKPNKSNTFKPLTAVVSSTSTATVISTTTITTAVTTTTTTTATIASTILHQASTTVKSATSAVLTKPISNIVSECSPLKPTCSVPFVSSKVPICVASTINVKPLNVNVSASSHKTPPHVKASDNFISNFDSHQAKEYTDAKSSEKKEKERKESYNSSMPMECKEMNKRKTEQEVSKAKLMERERKIEQLLPKLCLPETTITEDNIPQVDLKDLESESNDSEDLDIAEVNISEIQTKLTNSTSIAIQCDLDDSQSEKSQDDLKGNESGTQTDEPLKFPLPPSASPFYYLPLAMATLGEKLPAQLVQQMLAKTQGLVGAAEAGMILQQAAQLAQQYHKSSEDDEMPSLPPSSAVKPISPKSGSIALQKALKANLASIAQAEISVAQSSGLDLNPTPAQSLLMLHSDNKESKIFANINPKTLTKISSSLPEAQESVTNVSPLASSTAKVTKSSLETPENPPSSPEEKIQNKLESKDSVHVPNIKNIPVTKPRGKQARVNEVVKRRSGRSTTLAATKATESDLHEVEEMKRNRKARRAAAILAKEESWSSSSEAPLSPIMSPDMLRGWPPPRLTSPTPSQSSEGTNASSSTVSQRSRMSGPHSRRHSPASSSAESSRKYGGRYTSSSNNTFSTDPVIEPGPLRISDNPKLSRAPSFFPSEEEFTDPLDYIEKIRPEAEQFGLCRIVPPSNFRPECRVNDDMRFTAYKQYIHRMMRRWGPNDRTLCAIKKCLAKQNIDLTSIPVIGGVELDLVQLYNVVEKHGGLMKVIEKELWSKVADVLKIPKSTQDRLTKLDSIYCKYLLPYSTLSKEERENLLAEVDSNHSRTADERSKKSNETSDDEEDDEEPLECIVKGKSTALSAFYRIARNIACQWQPDPAGLQMDERYWEVVKESEYYICVHSASIDTAEHGYGFPCQKTSPNAKHPWNLKNMCQNSNSVLRSMGNVIGVTAPTLHIGMMFSTVCWYRDPHSLPWIEYLHTGACKIWYGVSSSNEEKFREALTKLVPDFIKTSPLWLPSDTAMVPPSDLVEEGVKVCRVVQEPGQFVVVFPGAFTSSVCSGYLISESAFFARPQYFDRAVATFQTLADCCEPSMFSLDRLVLAVASDAKATLEALVRARKVVVMVIEKEKRDRQTVVQLGLTASERLSPPDMYRKRKSRYVDEDEENCCEICRQHLYVSLVTNTKEETVYCLQHAIFFLTNNKSLLPFCKLMYTFSLPELTSILKQVDERIQTKTAVKKSSAAANKKGKFPELDSLSSTSSSNF